LAENQKKSDFQEYKRHLIVFVMAKSGKGEAVELWEECTKLLSKIYLKISSILTFYLKQEEAVPLRMSK